MDVLRILTELEQLVENSGGGLLGKRLVSEEKIIALVHQLRMAPSHSTNTARFTDSVEQLVKNSKVRFAGKCLIDEETFFVLLQQLRAAYS